MARKGYLTATITQPGGKRKYIYAKTKEELDEKVFHAKLELRMGVDLDDQTTVGELIQMWYTAEVAPGIKENTAANVKGILNNHLLPLCSSAIAREVTPVQVKMWLNETNKLNRGAARTCLRALRGAFMVAEENGIVLRSPVLSRYKAGGVPTKPRRALTPKEEETLLDLVAPTRAYLLVWFALATGARRGEICGLQWDCVNFDKATVDLRRNLVFLDRSRTELRDEMKTASGTRTVPLPLDLCCALRAEYVKAKSVFVFTDLAGRPYNNTSFRQAWGFVDRRFGPKVCDTSKIKHLKTDFKVTPHILRHTFATRCFEAGLDIKEVQYLLGHADPSITLQIYTHYCKESRAASTFEKARTARQRNGAATAAEAKCTTLVPHLGAKAAQN